MSANPEAGAAADPLWTIGDIEPLLHDMEAQTGILGHVANSNNEIEPGQLILIEDRYIDLQRRMLTLWHAAWDEHLAFRHGARTPVAADVRGICFARRPRWFSINATILGAPRPRRRRMVRMPN
jgi:hypothetical protein